MKRTIIKIDEELCNGCGLCVEGCHEGALQMIDGKARMISDLYCDGLGACIPECPVGAITLEEREAEPYDEIRVMERIAPKGAATVLAHLNHLIEHNQREFVEQGIRYIREHKPDIDLSRLKEYPKETNNMDEKNNEHPGRQAEDAGMTFSGHKHGNGHGQHAHGGGGCPGARMMQFADNISAPAAVATISEPHGHSAGQPSELRQWPVQMHLVNPQAPYFRKADVLLAADCVAFAMGDFHSKHLKGKGLAIACPKLDHNKELYIEKLTAMINQAEINTLTVMVMEVPCCTGLLQLAKQATEKAGRKVPVKAIKVSLRGEVIDEQWI
ncbi:MAG: 4Fe-4S ferredoxin [Bacteroidia bacterium]|nr:MAG: 4Fe-4S ferredoxin [Bacteroidia bacterium]